MYRRVRFVAGEDAGGRRSHSCGDDEADVQRRIWPATRHDALRERPLVTAGGSSHYPSGTSGTGRTTAEPPSATLGAWPASSVASSSEPASIRRKPWVSTSASGRSAAPSRVTARAVGTSGPPAASLPAFASAMAQSVQRWL